MPSFGEGLSEGLSNQIARSSQLKQQGMLEMMMLSKRIELEQQARQQEIEQQHQYSLVPGGAASAALKTLGVGDDKLGALANAFPEGMPEQMFGSLAQSLGMQARANAMINKPVHVATKPGSDNLVMQGFQEPMTGQWIGQPQVTLDPTAQREIEKADEASTNGINMVNGILQRAQSVLSNAPSGVPIQKLDTWFQSHGMPTNPDLKAFQDSLGSLSAQYIKDTTGMAPRSEQLMALDMGAFPNVTDDGPSAMRKAQILNTILQNKMQTVHNEYDPTNFLPSSQKIKGPSFADGIQSQKQKAALDYVNSIAAQFGKPQKGQGNATNQ